MRQKARLVRVAVYAVTLALVAVVVVATDWGRVQRAFFQWDVFTDQFPEILTRAARNTLIFTFFGFAIGLTLGLVLALMRLSPFRAYRWFATVVIEVLRGLPAMITIILIGYALPIALDIRVPGTYGPGSLALGLVTAAYLAETIRAGIEAVPRGQSEAARSLGMGGAAAMSWIVLPQAFRIVIPPLTNEFVILIKDTALLFVLGTTEDTRELTKFARDGVLDTFNITPLFVVGLVYLIITIPMTQAVAALERRNKRSR